MVHRPLSTIDRDNLTKALHRNAFHGSTILTDPHDTSFVGYSEEIPESNVIEAIKEVPSHY